MRRRLSERGATLPETAIVLTLLLAVMFGIVDFGRALYTYTFVATAAREGARWAIVRGAECTGLDHCPAQQGSADVQPYVQGLSEGATDPSKMSATLQFTGCSGGAAGGPVNARGCVAQVTVTYPFQFLLPFVNGGQILMTSSSQMVISH